MKTLDLEFILTLNNYKVFYRVFSKCIKLKSDFYYFIKTIV